MSRKDDQELLDELKRLVAEMLADLNGGGLKPQEPVESVLAADALANERSRGDTPCLMAPRRRAP